MDISGFALRKDNPLMLVFFIQLVTKNSFNEERNNENYMFF